MTVKSCPRFVLFSSYSNGVGSITDFVPHSLINWKLGILDKDKDSNTDQTNWFFGALYETYDNFITKTLPKAQQTRGLSSAYQINFFRSYHKLHKSWSNIFRISTKHQLQNLNQTSAFWQKLNLKILTRPSFRISTKIELHNHNQASVAK